MKTFNKQLLRVGLSCATALSAIQAHSQLPDNFLVKVSYKEHVSTTYSVPSNEDRALLSFRELAQYHSSSSLVQMHEYVDEDGDILTDKIFINEHNIRDEWMDGYSRIVVGKEDVSIYGKDDELIHHQSREYDPDEDYLSEAQALDYMQFHFDELTYEAFKAQLIELEIEVIEENGLLIGQKDEIDVIYNLNEQTISTRTYDDNGNRTSEHLVEYALLEEDIYYPARETHMEWMRSPSGPCILKTIVTEKFDFVRTINHSGERRTQGSNTKNTISESETEFDIQVSEDGEVFFIRSSSHRKQEIDIAIYSLAGKIVLSTSVKEGEAINLPQELPAGMYLIHIKSANRHKPVVGKIIRNNRSIKL